MRAKLILGICGVLVCLSAAPAMAGNKAKTSKDKQLLLPGKVVFVVGSDQLAPESDGVLKDVVVYLAGHKKVRKLRIEVHSDSRGSSGHNMKMSKQRAMSVAHWLVRAGVSCKRLVPVGFGESKPLVTPERTEQDRAQNRRVDFFIARVRGKKSKNPVDGGGQIAGDPCK